MHKEILTKNQIALLPLIGHFSNNFGLVGGTAIALQIGHRRSVDFDLFTNQDFDNSAIRNVIARVAKISKTLKDERGQYTVVVKGVTLTFLYYPYPIKFTKHMGKVINLSDLPTLAAMKAFALGRRAKWKDYADIYFIVKNHFTIDQIIKRARKIFGNEFNEKNFRIQLAYFKDIDYTEQIIYMKGFQTKDSVIKKALVQLSLK